MAFEIPITVKEAVNNIHSRKYLLPDIQRELVWRSEQIELLFDSLMRDYPIGSLLFWHLSKDHASGYEFYEFVRNYCELNGKHNPKANNRGNDGDIVSILDGQQRLTALYIGTKGTYAYKVARKRYNNPQAYPARKLYLNLKNDLSKYEDSDIAYDFRFLTEEESKDEGENIHWFEVGKILDFDEFQVNEYLLENCLKDSGRDEIFQFANRTLFKLHTTINKNTVINFYLEKSNELDKVLNIFIRVNNGGTKLNYTDLLLSMATAQWENIEARKEINDFVDDINRIGDGFNFDKDFILRACLVLSDFNNINFRISNFKKKNMQQIEMNWSNITQAIRSAVYLVGDFGYNRETLTSHNSIIPIAYYLLKIGLLYNFGESSKYIKDRKLIKKWLTRSLLKKVFGAHPENLYRAIREIIKDNTNNTLFPLDKIIDRFRGAEKSIAFSGDDIENLFFYEYGKSYTFSALSMLYPTFDFKNKFHVDHIFPESFFNKKKLREIGIEENKINSYLEKYNCLANLQLLEGTQNAEKSNIDFEKWLYETFSDDIERKEYMTKNYIPEDTALSIFDFEEFIKRRHDLMAKKYKSII